MMYREARVLSDLLLGMYKGLIEFLGWVIIIVSAMAGFAMGMKNGDSIYGLLGLALGLGGGFMIDVLLLPPLLILFKIYDRLGTIIDRRL